MWGFYNERNRTLANTLYQKLVNPDIAKIYKKNNKYGQDQVYPQKHLCPYLSKVTIEHDSYTCSIFNNSRPFPVRREGSCYVGKTFVQHVTKNSRQPNRFLPFTCVSMESQNCLSVQSVNSGWTVPKLNT